MKPETKSGSGSTRWVVHEIRNPLSAILLANQLAEEQLREGHPDMESLLALNAMIAKNISRIEQILQDIASRLQEQTAFFPVDLTVLMDHALQRIADRVEMQKITVMRSYGDPVVVMGDGEQLIIAFLNLLVNAIEAVAREEGKIWITILKADNQVKVIIKDNGMGIDPDKLELLFSRGISEKLNGMGIGLCHTKAILDLHEAAIAVNSSPGAGATFTISFTDLDPTA